MSDTNDKRNAEVTSLGNWCKAVLNYLLSLGPSRSISGMDRLVTAAVQRKNVSQLRVFRRDLAELVRGLSPAQQAAIRANTEEMDGAADDVDDETLVRMALERGQIETEDEYERLRTWLEFAQDQEARASDVQRVDALLTHFGTNVR